MKGRVRRNTVNKTKQNKLAIIPKHLSVGSSHTPRPKWLQIRSWPTVYTSPGTHGLEYSRFILPGYVNEFSVNNHFRHPISGSFLLRHDSRSPHSLRLPRPLVRNILYIHIKFAQQDEFSIVTWLLLTANHTHPHIIYIKVCIIWTERKQRDMLMCLANRGTNKITGQAKKNSLDLGFSSKRYGNSFSFSSWGRSTKRGKLEPVNLGVNNTTKFDLVSITDKGGWGGGCIIGPTVSPWLRRTSDPNWWTYRSAFAQL